MKSEAEVILKKGQGRLLKSGGAWIFDNEIAEVRGAYGNGGLVSVRDFDGYPMGTGFINRNSKIRVRMLTRDPQEENLAAIMNRCSHHFKLSILVPVRMVIRERDLPDTAIISISCP